MPFSSTVPLPPPNSQSFFEQLQAYYQDSIAYYLNQIEIAKEKLKALEILCDRDYEIREAIPEQSDRTHQTNQVQWLVASDCSEVNEAKGQTEANGNCDRHNGFNSGKNGVKLTQNKQLSLLENSERQNTQSPRAATRVAFNNGTYGNNQLANSNGYLVVTASPQITPLEFSTSASSQIEIPSAALSEDNRSVCPPAARVAETLSQETTATPEIQTIPELLSFEITAPKIATILQDNCGTIVEIEYLIRKLLGKHSPEVIAQIKPKLRAMLVRGQRQSLWDKVPDAPNCWTKDLTLLPDYAPPQPQLQKLSVFSKSEILLAAIDEFLKNAAPTSITSQAVAEQLIPADLSRSRRQYFLKRVQVLLANWTDQFGWKRLDNPDRSRAKRGAGVYLWQGQTDTVASRDAASKENTETSKATKDNSQERQMTVSDNSDSAKRTSNSSPNQAKAASSSSPDQFKNFPPSPQLSRYGTLIKAIAVFIKQKAPVPITASDLLNWLYPQGLDKEMKNKARKSVSSCLKQLCWL